MAPGKRSAIGGLATLAFGQRSCQQMLIDDFANQLVQQELLPLTCAAPAGLVVHSSCLHTSHKGNVFTQPPLCPHARCSPVALAGALELSDGP